MTGFFGGGDGAQSFDELGIYTQGTDLIVETGVRRITLDQQGHLTLDAQDFLF